MQLPIAVREPFVLEQSLAFLRRFPPCRDGVIVRADSVTAALALGDRAEPFTVRGAGADVVVEVADALHPTAAALVVERARAWLSTDDELGPFLAAAAGDHPAFRALVERLHGLHHVRFLTLAEIAVYAVLMQRTPMVQAARARARIAARFGPSVIVDGAGLAAADYREVVRLPRKAELLPQVVRGVAAIGEAFLRGAPYDEARAALLDVPGLGPFSAAAILLRGLGRMDDVPLEGEQFAGPARAIYGSAFEPVAIRRRYGDAVGYWSYYLKAGVPRLSGTRTEPQARRARNARANL